MEFSAKFDAKEIESQVLRYTKSIDLQKQISASDKPKTARFIEGPPTMNGIPHAGHLRGRVIKDLWYRFNTLQGTKIKFYGGWDTQGLPVELQAENELGVTGGKAEAIRRFGIERIVSECKKIVSKYNKTWVDVDEKLGISLDHGNAYWTFRDGFIEREWQVLKKAHENGILEEDYTVIAYCPHCQTSLSHAEVNQGYEQVTDPSLYYKVKLADEDAYLIVWTTMPFTLVTDAMVGLQPGEDYAYIQVKKETWIVGKTRLDEFADHAKIDYTIIKTAKGSDFEGKKYVHPLLDEIPKLAEHAAAANFHVAVSEPFVDSSTGSGLVHLSPANGEDDIMIANKRRVKVFNPIDDQVKFTGQAGRYSGMFVRDADDAIVRDLRDRGALVKTGKIKHKYPLCWRSRHRIVWLARRGWFYKLDRLGNKTVDAALGVEYFFEQPKNRFLAIIKERHPWCISRERIWGCPLPVWRCDECSSKNWLFSRQEIINAADSLPDGRDFELHRPWIDNITIRCKECNGTARREEYVLDTWHNSGSAPYSSLDDSEYQKEIPAPFFTEGIDQTRGWAYTLLVENVILNNNPVPPYKSFLFQGHVLDKDGGKMSKSKGNILGGSDLVAKYPVDMLRYYFVSKASPIEPLSFSTDELMSRPYQIVSTLYNLHLYFTQNSQYDGYDHSKNLGWAMQNNLLMPLDVWLLSKLQSLIATVTQKNQSCRFHEAAKALDDYLIGALSQTYVPITRSQLWDDDTQKRDRRLAIYAVLGHVLKALDILFHPFCPFTTQYLYKTVFDCENILLDSWPEHDASLVNHTVEESLDIMGTIVSVSSAARMKGRLKRRWPLDLAQICIKQGLESKLEPFSEMLRSRLNVEKFEIFEIKEETPLEQIFELQKLGILARGIVSLDRKQIGPKARQDMPKLLERFEQSDQQEILSELRQNGRYDFDVGSRTITLERQDFVIQLDAGENFEVAGRDDCIVFVSTVRNKDMMAKGLLKDIARRLQTLRKERGYNPTDMLGAASVLDLDAESQQMIQARAKELAFLVRAEKVTFEQDCSSYKDEEIDGQKIRIAIE